MFKLIGDWVKQIKLLKEKLQQLTAKDLKLEPIKDPVQLNREGIKLDNKRPEVISLLKGLKPMKPI